MKTVTRTQFNGSTEQLAARVQAFKDALAVHAVTVGVPAPREEDWVEALARTGEPFEVEEPAPQPVVKVPTLAERKAEAMLRVNYAFENAAARLVGEYPPSERLTWPIQEAEAIGRLANPAAPTPYLDALAAGRGVTTEHLVQRVAANSAAWRAASAQFLAERHKGEDAIAAALDEAGINAARDAAVAALGAV